MRTKLNLMLVKLPPGHFPGELTCLAAPSAGREAVSPGQTVTPRSLYLHLVYLVDQDKKTAHKALGVLQ